MNDANRETPLGIHLKLFGRTDVGQVREHNEDNFLLADLTNGTRGLREQDRQPSVGRAGNVFGVCDGMGGAAAGEVASQLAVDILFERLSESDAAGSKDQLARNLVQAVEAAGLRIYAEARADRSRRGMGTTATVAALMSDCLFLAQVGDSRGYILRDTELVQVTRDQSLVNQLIEAGQLTEEEAETFEHNNIILQALGTAETVQVDLTYVELRQGDILLLCSDGLSGMIRDHEIRDVLQRIEDPLQACRELTDRANAAGGHDNITVVVVHFLGDGLQTVSPDDEPLAYRKYSLPPAEEQTPPHDNLAAPDSKPSTGSDADRSTTIEGSIAPSTAESDDEARGLRVSHTVLGSVTSAEAVALAPGGAPPSKLKHLEDPIDLPTTGLPPHFIGVILAVALLLLAVVGFYLLR